MGLPVAKKCLRTIIRIDLYVVFSQIAGPATCGGLALVKIDCQSDLVSGKDPGSLLLIEPDAAPLSRDYKAIDINFNERRIKLRPTTTGRRNNTAPIGIFTSNRCLDQRTRGHGLRDAPCIDHRRRPAYIDRDQLACTLSVASYIDSQVLTDG